jgi:hypothetical protein
MAIELSGQVSANRGGHPYVVVGEADAAFRVLEQIDGTYRSGSFSSGKQFHEPVTVLIGGVEHKATGLGAIFYEYTRERNRRTGRVKEIKVEGSGQRYVYLYEAPVVTAGPSVRDDRFDGMTPDEIEHWRDFGSAARESRREDY